MQNYTHNANGDVPLSIECVIFLISFEIRVHTCSFEKKDKTSNIILAGIACSKSKIEFLEQSMKYVQSQEERPQNNIIDVVLEP